MISNSVGYMITLIFFYNQPIYNQIVLGWQIAKPVSGFTLFSLSNNKNYRVKKIEVFLL